MFTKFRKGNNFVETIKYIYVIYKIDSLNAKWFENFRKGKYNLREVP